MDDATTRHLPVDRYTRTAVVLHWLIAVLIVVNVGLGLSFDLVAEENVRPLVDNHKSTGLLVLGLVLLRVLWRVAHRPPPMPTRYERWEKWGAHVVHALLYVLLLALPISGWMHDSAFKGAAEHPLTIFGLPFFRIPWIEHIADPGRKEELHGLFGTMHVAFGYVLYAALALHLVGALKHQWLDREPELQRMSL